MSSKRTAGKTNEVAAQNSPAKKGSGAAATEDTMSDRKRVKSVPDQKRVQTAFTRQQYKLLKMSAAAAEVTMSLYVQEAVLAQIRADGLFKP